MSSELLVYTLRPPEWTALWLPISLTETMRVQRGDRLTREQLESRAVQSLLAERQRRTP